MIPIQGHSLKLNHDSGSQFNIEFRPGIAIQRGIKTWITIQRGIMTRVKCQRGILTRVKIQRGIMTRGHIKTWNYEPGSQFNVEL